MSVIGLAIVLVIGLAAGMIVYLLVSKTRRGRYSQRQHIPDERDANAGPQNHPSAIAHPERGDEARSPTALGSRYTHLENDPTHATSVELGSVLMDLSELETDLALARQSKDTDLALKIRLEMDDLENRASELEKQLVNGRDIRRD
ncbi:flagellar basal body-associated protein FliL [Bradyrhizobium sp. USDA 4524]|uniref:hypothetical protein n=1 Tax=unclassified Bradyrhizobium TaxID=2631580 RepID=UPI00209D489A|nr:MULTISPECIES: hypothetical protein [unclassified Bradyrhizobium]MCP1838827.1 flagellar basal body-associated protein FliL [Bradyrhizobium sp. USDA 4538]MCP1899394.1 flagellar basal body-associated protein FliL [Bradyrhizobium sp. USDA 4537]MCP1986495.1 flagellar basal body-associated protein FliL [Bradyrhizobium sp. USDA 4539]